jgi:hypothetical protein
LIFGTIRGGMYSVQICIVCFQVARGWSIAEGSVPKKQASYACLFHTTKKEDIPGVAIREIKKDCPKKVSRMGSTFSNGKDIVICYVRLNVSTDAATSNCVKFI